MAFPVPSNLSGNVEFSSQANYPGSIQPEGRGSPQPVEPYSRKDWTSPSNTAVRARELRRAQQKQQLHAQRGNPSGTASRLTALERENITRQNARRARRTTQEANSPPSSTLHRTCQDTAGSPARLQPLPAKTPPEPDALELARPVQLNRLGQKMWETGMVLGWQLLDSLVPRFPVAGAIAVDMQAQTCTGPECDGEKRSRLHNAPETLDSFQARGSEHFHFHLSDSLAGKTSLHGKLVIFVFDPDLHASGEQPWRTLFDEALRKGDVLLKERQQSWRVPSESLGPLDTQSWKQFGKKIDGTELQVLHRLSRHTMEPLIDALKTAFTTEVTLDVTFWDMNYHDQVSLLQKLITRIEFMGPDSPEQKKVFKRVGECYDAFSSANRKVQLEKSRLSELRARHFLADRNYLAAAQTGTRFAVMDSELVARLGLSLLQNTDCVIITDKRAPMNLDQKPSYGHPTTIRHVQELVAAENGRTLISPALQNRPDQSLAGTVIVFADEEHGRFEGQWLELTWSLKMLKETDKRLVELPSEKKLSGPICMGMPRKCHGIDDTESRKKIDIDLEKARACFIAFSAALEADGMVFELPLEALQRMSAHELDQKLEHAVELFSPVRESGLLSGSASEHFHKLREAEASLRKVITELNPIRNRAMLGAMKAHLSADHACIARLGAYHVSEMQTQLLDELPAIIIWPDDPDTVWARHVMAESRKE